MKPIKKGELYRHLSEFLRKKGVELHKGPYPGRIEQVCRLLSETINATQGTLDRARKGMDQGLKQMRQALKKKRAKPVPGTSPFAAPASPTPPKPRSKSTKSSRTRARKSGPKRGTKSP